jgi:RNA polymerase sigma-70 factor (ECF subfamily)
MRSDIVDKLFSEYYNEALLYTVSICRNKTIAEDIVSNAFFKALTLADESVQSFKPWLLTVCRNEYISLYRKNSRLVTGDLEDDLPDNREEIVESIIRKEEYRSLYRAIELLPDNQREVIMLFYFSNLPVKEIAGITGKSEINTKVQLCRAREKLKNIMEERS